MEEYDVYTNSGLVEDIFIFDKRGRGRCLFTSTGFEDWLVEPVALLTGDILLNQSLLERIQKNEFANR